MIVEELCPAAHTEWDAYVDTHPKANCYHLRAWQAVAQRAYRLRAPFLMVRDTTGGPVRGVLPLFIVRSPLGGYVTTGLFGAYGPILADGEKACRALIGEARRITDEEGTSYLAIKALGDGPTLDLDRRDMCVISRLPLEPHPDLMWKKFRGEIRTAIRKAQHSELIVLTGSAHLSAYYDVLAENMHHKGTPIYGYSFMRELVQALGDRCEVVTMWVDGLPVSAALLIYHGHTVHTPFMSSVPWSFKLRPNNLLYWEIIQRGCGRGMEFVDFGRSPRGSSSLTFKLRWGAEVMPQPWYIYTSRGKPPDLDPDSASVQRLVRLWQHLPRPLADVLGPSVCRRWLV